MKIEDFDAVQNAFRSTDAVGVFSPMGANGETVEINVLKADEFLGAIKDVLARYMSDPGDEEEFVVALEHFVSTRNGVRTESAAYRSISGWYEGTMPIGMIVFDELIKHGDIPDDINAWIIGLFENGIIKAGEIEVSAKSISSDFAERFRNRWS
jgi:hypothetical protein